MADWQTVRFDPSYEEPLDIEIVPLCDALNAAGFVTESSCCGHGHRRPIVWFEHSSDGRIESMAKFVLAHELADFGLFCTTFQKEVRLDRYVWSISIQPNDVYQTTPMDEALAKAVSAMGEVTAIINRWNDIGIKEAALFVLSAKSAWSNTAAFR